VYIQSVAHTICVLLWHFDSVNQIYSPNPTLIELNHNPAFFFAANLSHADSLRMERPRLCFSEMLLSCLDVHTCVNAHLKISFCSLFVCVWVFMRVLKQKPAPIKQINPTQLKLWIKHVVPSLSLISVCVCVCVCVCLCACAFPCICSASLAIFLYHSEHVLWLGFQKVDCVSLHTCFCIVWCIWPSK